MADWDFGSDLDATPLQIKDKPPVTQSMYKRKAPNSEETKFIILPFKKRKIDICSAIENLSLSYFKSYIFWEIHNQNTPELGDNTKQPNKNGLITWEVSMPHGGTFEEKNKACINNAHIFSKFVKVISAPGEEGEKFIVTLIEKDSNVVAQVAMRSLFSSTGRTQMI
ncbi:hypothetical protein VP01_1637g5 [Puccinia sorghi]|uniref:Uncharacterized protein n=1 Tax=Puccinia sorghi TaxID=27349 RepID=A0A0L6VGT7_9BASI|nr:hypothetical protein VP01_1637g5 [Puccinia sorghi]